MLHPVVWALTCSLLVFEENTRWAERSFEMAPGFIRVHGVHRAVLVHLKGGPDREGGGAGQRLATGLRSTGHGTYEVILLNMKAGLGIGERGKECWDILPPQLHEAVAEHIQQQQRSSRSRQQTEDKHR